MKPYIEISFFMYSFFICRLIFCENKLYKSKQAPKKPQNLTNIR